MTDHIDSSKSSVNSSVTPTSPESLPKGETQAGQKVTVQPTKNRTLPSVTSLSAAPIPARPVPELFPVSSVRASSLPAIPMAVKTSQAASKQQISQSTNNSNQVLEKMKSVSNFLDEMQKFKLSDSIPKELVKKFEETDPLSKNHEQAQKLLDKALYDFVKNALAKLPAVPKLTLHPEHQRSASAMVSSQSAIQASSSSPRGVLQYISFMSMAHNALTTLQRVFSDFAKNDGFKGLLMQKKIQFGICLLEVNEKLENLNKDLSNGLPNTFLDNKQRNRAQLNTSIINLLLTDVSANVVPHSGVDVVLDELIKSISTFPGKSNTGITELLKLDQKIAKWDKDLAKQNNSSIPSDRFRLAYAITKYAKRLAEFSDEEKGIMKTLTNPLKCKAFLFSEVNTTKTVNTLSKQIAFDIYSGIVVHVLNSEANLILRILKENNVPLYDAVIKLLNVEVPGLLEKYNEKFGQQIQEMQQSEMRRLQTKK